MRDRRKRSRVNYKDRMKMILKKMRSFANSCLTKDSTLIWSPKIPSKRTEIHAKQRAIAESDDVPSLRMQHSSPRQGEYKMRAENLRGVCGAFEEVSGEVMVTIESGRTFDLRSVKIKKHVPDTKQFRIFTYKNPRSKRHIKVLKCDHEGCDKWFRKWHNFFDHLRIHTNERPYVCPI